MKTATTALARTIARHENVIDSLHAAPVRCAETLRDYREEVDALHRALAVLTAEEIGDG